MSPVPSPGVIASLMDIILCHETADFDALGAAVGAARLYPGARIVLTGGAHQSVRDFLALHRDEYPLLELRSVDERSLRHVVLVDVQSSRRLGKAAAWLQDPEVAVHVYDHHIGDRKHPELPQDYTPALWCVEPVGATSTLMVERLQAKEIELTPFEVTALALGIHVDTGSLTFGSSTARDARALAWLMERGVNLDVIATYIDRGLTPTMQELLARSLDELPAVTKSLSGYKIAVWSVCSDEYLRGFAGIVERAIELTDLDVLVAIAQQDKRISAIGRSQHDFAQLQTLMARYGGGGHARAASASLKRDTIEIEDLVNGIWTHLRDCIPTPVRAADIMSSPVRTIRPDTTIDEAERILLRYGHSGLSVVNACDRLVGVISRRDLDLALHHGFGHAPVRAYMSAPVRTTSPDTSLHQIQEIMLKWDIGRLPVLDGEDLVGVVTRTDVLRQLHNLSPNQRQSQPLRDRLQVRLQQMLPERYWTILQQAAAAADRLGLHLYLVGGTVRDLLLERATDDLDLVVDGRHPQAEPGATEPEGWGATLARALQTDFPEARLELHGKFQTAALIWPDGLWIDIATARTEFYPYPAALPEVAASSIQQDLYRRDFSINALALRLNGLQAGEILDFFGGLEDLECQTIRVLHPNSFIEDPTRLFRAIRFAVRLGFSLDDRTRDYAREASAIGGDRVLSSAVREQGPRLKQELSYIFRADRWWLAFEQLQELNALRYVHPQLHWHPSLRQAVRRAGAWAHHFAPRYRELHHHSTIWQLRFECLLGYCTTTTETTTTETTTPKTATPEATNTRTTTSETIAATAAAMDWPHDGIRRLRNLSSWQKRLFPLLSEARAPSQVAGLLDSLSPPDLVLLAAIAPPPIRQSIWQYLDRWRSVKAPISGHDLKALGYTPGPQFKAILQTLRNATLDGEVSTTTEALAWLKRNFSS